MPFCNTCDEYRYDSQHTCPPKWRVWRRDELSADGRVVYARTAEYAAQKWGEQEDHDTAENLIVNGEEVRILVRPENDVGAIPVLFRVYGEWQPTYYAEELEDS